MTVTEMLSHRVTLAVGILVLIGSLTGFADQRYALASDSEARDQNVTDLTAMILDDRIEDLEYRIEEVEQSLGRIDHIAEVDREPWMKAELNALENRKEKYLRKLERLNR